jgi:hypothetical protein
MDNLATMKSKWFILLVLLSAYLNIIAFGFAYGTGIHTIHLALVNWLRNPSLYPNDPLIEAFAWFPTSFWPAVAYASAWMSTQQLLFAVFILTKVLFFSALVRLVTNALKNGYLVACIVFSIALSPLLSGSVTPLSYSDVLRPVPTQTSLAIALLLWVGALWLEKRWLSAAVLLGIAIHINALFGLFTLVALIVLALYDWQEYKRQIVASLISIGIIGLPWLILSHSATPTAFPHNYVETLLMFYPYHHTLRSHSTFDLVLGSEMFMAAVCMVIAAVKLGITRHPRLELLAGAFLLPFLLGALIGEVFPSPNLMRLQFLRSESFLLLYSMILAQVYGARILLSSQIRDPMALLLGALALLMPLSNACTLCNLEYIGLLLLLLLSVLWILDPSALAVFVSAAGLTLIRVLGQTWVPGRVVAAVAVASGLFWAKPRCLTEIFGKIPHSVIAISDRIVAPLNRRIRGTNPTKLTLVICGLMIIAIVEPIAIPGAIRPWTRPWNPTIAPTALLDAWRDVQQWAKSNTPQDAKFLVPPYPYGFRVFSERVSWGEWRDGDAIYTFPAFADEWRRRMGAVGIPLTTEDHKHNYTMLQRYYKEQSWEHLLAVAREHQINYLVQYTEVPYGVPSVFRNKEFAVYRVTE